MVEFGQAKDVEAWLNDKPREWAVVLATRAALRATPALAVLIDGTHIPARQRAVILLPVFRAMIISWAAAKYPARSNEMRVAADSANSVFDAAGLAAARATAAADGAADAAFKASATLVAGQALIVSHAAYAGLAANSAAIGAAYAAQPAFDATAAAILEAISADARLLKSSMLSDALALQPLWPWGERAWAADNWAQLKQSLLLPESEPIRKENWQVWIDWYEARRDGRDPWPEEVEVACALIPDEIWEQGPAAANAEIKRIRDEWAEKQKAQSGHIAKSPDEIRTALANVASPSPILRDGKIDVGPNPIFDKAQYSDDLPGLPERQRILIRVILNGLPRNAPAYLLSSLQEYSDHLNQRGVEPIVGVLKDMGAIIDAAVTARNAADEWLAEEQRAAFDRFNNNHERLIEHFPLDKQREDTYANMPVEESKIEAGALHRPLEDVAEKAREAAQAGLVADDFAKVVQAMADNGKIIESLPPEIGSVPEMQVSPDDRIIAVPKRVSVKKRALLNQTGFVARSVEVIAQSASIASIVPGAALLESLRNALTVLMRAFH